MHASKMNSICGTCFHRAVFVPIGPLDLDAAKQLIKASHSRTGRIRSGSLSELLFHRKPSLPLEQFGFD
jgi:hypothetical protein